MVREEIPLQDGLFELVLVMQSAEESQKYQHYIPHPLPAGHTVEVFWEEPDKPDSHPRKLHFRVVPVEGKAAGKGKPTQAPDRMRDLMKMDDATLQDLAPKLGVLDAATQLKRPGGKQRLCAQLYQIEQKATKPPTPGQAT